MSYSWKGEFNRLLRQLTPKRRAEVERRRRIVGDQDVFVEMLLERSYQLISDEELEAELAWANANGVKFHDPSTWHKLDAMPRPDAQAKGHERPL